MLFFHALEVTVVAIIPFPLRVQCILLCARGIEAFGALVVNVFLMTVQSKTIATSSATNIAIHRIMHQMFAMYVCCKTGFLNKGYVAIIAHVRLVTGMNNLMHSKIGLVSEGCVTDNTSKRLVTGVHINMPIQIYISIQMSSHTHYTYTFFSHSLCMSLCLLRFF